MSAEFTPSFKSPDNQDDYYGDLISDKLSNNSENINISIDLQSLLKYRKKFGFLKDQDSFELC